jgi:hypothetical protein
MQTGEMVFYAKEQNENGLITGKLYVVADYFLDSNHNETTGEITKEEMVKVQDAFGNLYGPVSKNYFCQAEYYEDYLNEKNRIWGKILTELKRKVVDAETKAEKNIQIIKDIKEMRRDPRINSFFERNRA